VQQLLDHKGGYNDGTNPKYAAALDPTYSMRQIGQALGHVVNGKLDVAHYMYGQPLQFAPGTDSAYSNYGYLLLGLVLMFGPVLWLVLSSFKSAAALNEFPPQLLPYGQATVTLPGK